MSAAQFLESPQAQKIDLNVAIRDLPDLLKQVDAVGWGKSPLLIVDGIRTTQKLIGIRRSTARNASRVNESIFGYVYNVIWLVKYINNMFKSTWGGGDLIYINSIFGDRVDVVTNPNSDPYQGTAALLLVSMMLKLHSSVGTNVRTVIAQQGQDWEMKYSSRGSMLINQLDFESNLIANLKNAASQKGVNERTGILFSDNFHSLESLLRENLYISDQCVPVADLWNRDVLDTTTDQIPQIELTFPEIVSTCTLVVSGENREEVASYIIDGLLSRTKLEIQGGPDSEKGWEWYSIRMSNGTDIETLRELIFDMSVLADITFSKSLVGITVGTGMWLNVAEHKLVMHPYAAAIFSRIMYQLKYTGNEGVYSVGNLAPIKFKTDLRPLDGWDSELIAKATSGPSIRYIDDKDPKVDNTGNNIATFLLAQPHICLPGGKLDEAVKLFRDALHADNRVNAATCYLAEILLNNNKISVLDSSSVLIHEWLENLPAYYQWVIACFGIVGDAADEQFIILVNALLKDGKSAEVDMASFSQLLENTVQFSEPSSLLYSFAFTMNEWALDLMRAESNDFRMFFRDLFHFLIQDQSCEQIAQSEFIKQIIPLIGFFDKAAKEIPGVFELIPHEERTKAALGVSLYLHRQGLKFRDVLVMCDPSDLKRNTIERELYLLLSLAEEQENGDFLGDEMYEEYKRSLFTNKNASRLTTKMGYRLRMMVLGKERPVSQNYGGKSWREIDFAQVPRAEIMRSVAERTEVLMDQIEYLRSNSYGGEDINLSYLNMEFVSLVEDVNKLLNFYIRYIHTNSCFELTGKLVELKAALQQISVEFRFESDHIARSFLSSAFVETCYSMQQATSLRSFPVGFDKLSVNEKATVCETDIDAANRLIMEMDMRENRIFVESNSLGLGDEQIKSIEVLLQEASAIMRIRRANLNLIRSQYPSWEMDTVLIDECIEDMYGLLESEPINHIVSSRSLINLLALIGRFRKQNITLEEMSVYGGTAVVNAIQTGDNIFASIINVFASFAEETHEGEITKKIDSLFADQKVLLAYDTLIESLPKWLDEEVDFNNDRKMMLIKNYVEAVLGVVLRYGIDSKFPTKLERLLNVVYFELELFSNENRLSLHPDAAKEAMKYMIFQKEPTLIQVIGSSGVSEI